MLSKIVVAGYFQQFSSFRSEFYAFSYSQVLKSSEEYPSDRSEVHSPKRQDKFKIN